MEPLLTPLQRDLFALLERDCGEAHGARRCHADTKDFIRQSEIVLCLWGTLMARGSQLQAAKRVKLNRNTVYKILKRLPFDIREVFAESNFSPIVMRKKLGV